MILGCVMSRLLFVLLPSDLHGLHESLSILNECCGKFLTIPMYSADVVIVARSSE